MNMLYNVGWDRKIIVITEQNTFRTVIFNPRHPGAFCVEVVHFCTFISFCIEVVTA